MTANTTVHIERRGPQIVGRVGNSYGLAMNLFRAALDHKKHCGENCNVSLTQIQLAATRVMQHGASLRECRDFAKWEWPS